jgi:hypothetical protein
VDRPGSKLYLSVDEEEEFSTFLKTCSDIGYGQNEEGYHVHCPIGI